MIVTQFAEPHILRTLRNEVSGFDPVSIEWPNVVVHTKEKSFSKFIPETSLTVLTNLSGNASCLVDGRPYTLCPSTYLIVNPYQQLSYTIHGTGVTEAVNIHMNFSWFRQASSYYSGNWFGQEETDKHSIPVFYNELQYKDPLFQSAIHHLLQASGNEALEERQSELFAILIHQYSAYRNRLKRLPVKKPGTRTDVYRRLSIAKDILYSSYAQPLSMEVLCREIGMSQFHFIRLFTWCYGSSPYRMLRMVRLTKATELLASSGYSIYEIAALTGFEESNSFISAFKKEYGMPPGQYRNK